MNSKRLWLILNTNLKSSLESKVSLRWKSSFLSYHIHMIGLWRHYCFFLSDIHFFQVAGHPDAATVVTGIVGCAGLKVKQLSPQLLLWLTQFKKFAIAISFCYFLQPTVAAIEAGKDIALANKETMIAGGAFVLPLAHKNNIKILPADSEHSAIFQVF